MSIVLRFFLLINSILIVASSLLNAQTLHSIETQSDYYYRLLQISGKSQDDISFTIRPIEPEPALIRDNPWINFVRYTKSPSLRIGELNTFLFEPALISSFNSTLPRGLNDGPIWQGRGLNSALSTGFYANYGVLHLKFKPVFGFTQNTHFDLGNYPETNGSPYNYRIRPQIDLVQRFGDKSYTWTDLGDTYIAVRYRGWNVGLSNQRIWTGPSTTFPLIFSYQGPGFIHATVSSYRPLFTPIGHFEFNYVYGGVKSSEYFTNRSNASITLLHSLILTYSPKYINGFSLGVQRQFMEDYDADFEYIVDRIRKMFEPFTKQDLREQSLTELENQLATVFFRWVFPESGFEIYGEFGKNDHSENNRDLRLQLDHQSAYSLGLTKTFNTGNNGIVGLNFESTVTENTRNALTRNAGINAATPGNLGLLGSWYTHTNQNVGFTNRGQMIGSGFGPGGNAQLLQFDYFYPKGKWGASISRIEYHNTLVDNVSINRNFYEIIMSQNPEDTERWELRNTEFVLAVDHTRMVKYGIEVSAAVEVSRILNHQYLRGNDLWNTRFELILRKHIAGGLR